MNIREWLTWIQSIETQGAFTGALTGMTATTEGTFEWVRIGRRVTLFLQTALSGTSNTTAMTLTGIPAAVGLENTALFVSPVTDSGGTEVSVGSLSNTTITFSIGSPASSTGFTNSGTKGLPAGWAFSYLLEQ